MRLLEKIVAKLMQKKEDNRRLYFWYHMALFLVPYGSFYGDRLFFIIRHNQATAYGVDCKFHYVIKFSLLQNG